MAQAAQLKWVGCGISKQGFMKSLAAAYESETGNTIVIEGGGATRGIRDVAAGAADMGGSCRHKILHDEERNVKLIPVGWDALVAITHPSNPVKSISLAHLRAVFEGRIKNWRELGGPDAPIELVVRSGRISGVGLLVRELVFQDPSYKFPKNAIRVRSTGPLEAKVESSRFALAFTGISSGRKRDVKVLQLDGQAPSYDKIAAGKYPLVRPLYLAVPRSPGEEVAEFIRFATGPEGQSIIKRQGTVNLKDGAKLWPKFRKAFKDAEKKGAS
jgi:phosphate transport system substrate-binding protein